MRRRGRLSLLLSGRSSSEMAALRGPIAGNNSRRVAGPGTIAAAALALTTMALGGCTPYENLFGEYKLSAVDPIKFPKPYLGDGGNGKRPGSGSFQYIAGHVNKAPVSYYLLDLHGRQARASDPLDLAGLNVPLGYVFDPGSRGPDEDSSRCQGPASYNWDDPETRRLDAVRRDRQGAVFTQLPVDTDPAGGTTYVPIVSEVVVTSTALRCQDIKSQATLIERAGVEVQLPLVPPETMLPDDKPTGRPTGRFLAYAIIDPSADVLYPESQVKGGHDAVDKLGPQRWGWFDKYLLAYLDGGYIPIEPLSPGGKLRARTQRLFYPAKVWDAESMMLVDGARGVGDDVLEFRRGDEGYSPLCRVFTFEPKNPQMALEQSVAEIDQSTVQDTGELVYCLQTQRTPRSQP